MLDIDGFCLRELTTGGGYNYYLLYNERNYQLLLRQDERLCCINLDGHVIYRYNISGLMGPVVDHIYQSGYLSNDAQMLSPDGIFLDIALSKHDDVYQPCAITFKKDYTKLFIISRGESVLVYSCI